MFALFEAIFIVLFVLFGVAAVVGHWLVFAAVSHHPLDETEQAAPQAEPKPLRLAA